MGPSWRRAMTACCAAVALTGFAPAVGACQQPARSVRKTAWVQPSAADSTWLLYKGYAYGSDAYFSPVTLFLAKGYDVFQLRDNERNVLTFPYRLNWSTGVRDIYRIPGVLVKRYGGWRRFAGYELFPSSWDVDTWNWLPNYTEHLLAGGLSMRMLDEWYRQHGVPFPRALAMATTYAASLMNEVTEQGGYRYPSAGSVADLLVFDAAAVLLFHWRQPTEFFARTLQASDWENQAALTFPGRRLQNNGQYFTLKVPVGLERTRLFIRGGVGAQFGVSRMIDDSHHLSVAFGGDTRQRRIDATGHETVRFAPGGGIYYDRNNSLLWSANTGPGENVLVVNVYPGVLPGTARRFGLWGVVTRAGEVHVGFVLRGALGLGSGYGP
jgi:hypothetical protein